MAFQVSHSRRQRLHLESQEREEGEPFPTPQTTEKVTRWLWLKMADPWVAARVQGGV